MGRRWGWTALADRPRNRMARFDGPARWDVFATAYLAMIVGNVLVAARAAWELVGAPAGSLEWQALLLVTLWAGSTALVMVLMDREAVRVHKELKALWPEKEDLGDLGPRVCASWPPCEGTPLPGDEYCPTCQEEGDE